MLLTITQTPGGDYRLSFAEADAFGALWPVVMIADYPTEREAGAAFRAGVAASDLLSGMFGAAVDRVG